MFQSLLFGGIFYFRPMDIEQLRQICLAFPGTSEDVKWECHLVFSVAGKMFVMADLEEPFKRSFKVKDEDFEEYCGREGLQPAPHLARAKWVSVIEYGKLSRREWEQCIRTSYELVAAKLPKKIRKELNL
jgi:predicted DNA-binding protein (MmcQ/YjbR family)